MDAPVVRDLSALKTIVAALVAMAGFWRGGKTLPRHLHRALLRLMRPAEAAVRRLVIVLARGVVLRESALRPHRWQKVARVKAQPSLPLSVPLLDPLKRFRRARPSRIAVPRISMPGVTAPFAIAPRHAPRPDDPIDATRLKARLDALQRALENPAPLAARMARWQARRGLRLRVTDAKDARARYRRPLRISPLRPGHPPGHFSASRRAGDRHKVHDLLEHAQELALFALTRRDTS